MAIDVRVQVADFDVGAELAKLRVRQPAIGAIASFVGVVRETSDGGGHDGGSDAADRHASVGSLTLEHYPGMTEKSLEAICATACARWSLIDAVVVHRVGTLRPTEQIVLVATSAAHRGAAFDACAFIMDFLKTEAPFWKKEATPDGDRWVEARASDADAASRWAPAGRP